MTDVIKALQDDFKLFLQALWEQLDLPQPTRAQYAIADYLQHGPKRLQIQAFRGVGKSWITGAFVLWTLFKDPERKIMIISASKEILRLIATNKGPPEYLIALGYSGWEPGQLEQEIQHNDWLTAPCAPHILFDTPAEQRWKASARLLGINIDQLSDQTGHA